jgi:hypothetical protein
MSQVLESVFRRWIQALEKRYRVQDGELQEVLSQLLAWFGRGILKVE